MKKIKIFFSMAITLALAGVGTQKGLPLLHRVVKRGLILPTQVLLEWGGNQDLRDAQGNTPLHYAGDRHIASLLINAGADVNAVNDRGDTPLHTVQHNAPPRVVPLIVRSLIQAGADVDIANNEGNTPLHVIRSTEVAKILLAKGASIEARNNDDATPLHLAAADRTGKAQLLIRRGAVVGVRDQFGNSPLHVAAAFHRPELVLQLIKKGVSPNVQNSRGLTPLHVALGMGSIVDGTDRTTLKDLGIVAGAGVLGTGAALVLGPGLLVISIPLLVRGSIGIVSGLVGLSVNFRKTAKVLVENGAKVNARDELGNTPLHIMSAGRAFQPGALKGGPLLARYLMRHGADPMRANNEGKTAYDVAKAFRRIGLMAVYRPRIRSGVAAVKARVKKVGEKVRGAWRQAAPAAQ